MRALVCSMAFVLGGCLGVDLGGNDGGADGAADSGASSDAPNATVTGTDCGVEPTSGATLCLGISLCPNLVIDRDAFPHCGFRIHGEAIDLECGCTGGALCPVGATATCDQAKALLAVQSETQVCVGVSLGQCVGGVGVGAGGTGTNPCDKNCASECGGDPGCLLACGC